MLRPSVAHQLAVSFEPGHRPAGLDLLVAALVAGGLDLPDAFFLHVLVDVEGGAADRDVPRRVDHDVFERPRPDRGRRAREVDLGVVAPVAREERLGAHRAGEEVEDLGPAVERVLAAAVRRGRVFGEARLDRFPVLLVEAAEVPVLQSLDRVRFLRGHRESSPAVSIIWSRAAPDRLHARLTSTERRPWLATRGPTGQCSARSDGASGFERDERATPGPRQRVRKRGKS